MRSIVPRLLFAVILWGAWQGAASAAPGYLRQPDISGDRVVFCAEEDLWLTDLSGAVPRRITSALGNEYFPHFSPDGTTIAFTGDYDGNLDVFVMPVEGGEPTRLTWHPTRDEVIGWTPDGTKVIFRSRRDAPNYSWELFTVPVEGGEPEKLPLGWAGRIDMDPASGAWAFTRGERERRTWKRYRGGTADVIWAGHPDREDYAPVTTFEGENAFPMWHGGRIYYICDQGGTFNIWSILPDGTDRRQHTQHDEWDVRWPAMGPEGRIAYILGADIHVFDTASGSDRALTIDLPSDRVLTRVRYPDPERYLTWFMPSPEGDRVELVTRGEIYSLPVEKGPTLPVSHGSGARESWGSYSPDGKRLVYVTDETGEESIVTADAWGRGDRKTIVPAGESGWHFPPLWSPDGKWVAYADQTYALYVVPAEGGTPTLAARGAYWEISEYAWSPDGRWLAYTDWLPSEFRVIKIYDTKEKKTVQVTGGTTDSWSPVWDPEGRYLYFLSNRSVNPLLGSRDMEDILLKPVLPYAILLRPDVENPFAEKGGLPDGDKDKKAEEKGDKDNKGEEAPQPVAIDFDGIADRVAEVPADAGFYGRLSATATHLFYVSYPIKGMAEEPPLFAEEAEGENTLMSFDLEKKKARTFMDHMTAYELAAKGEKLAVLKKPGSLYVVEAGSPPGDDLSENQVSWDGIVLELDPRAEWKQMYYEGWRNMRDFFWDPGMGGVDWKAVRDRYATLLPRLATRSDLVDLMGEVIGELSNSHTYVFGGDPGKKVPHVSVGLLGADVAREGDAFRVTRIYRGDPADREPSPLDAPGVKVKEGDYILAVNHLPFPPGEPFYSRFEDLAGKTVTLTVNTRPDRKTARDVVVTPLGDDHRLHYVDWTRRNREYVDRKTGGKIGYLHLPDMMTDGLVQFDTWFYPQIRKEGMIIDGRWNGGGFLSQLIVERMRRKVISFDRNRAGNVSGTYPWRAINGPFVVLTNQFAGSDGDIFPAAVQMEGLAPVIGKRTWGGVIGIRADKRLVDGGWLTEPEFAWWDPQRGYGLENRGAVPDIEVEDLPQDVARGVDAQLDRAIAEAMRLHEEHPPLRPDFGPTPVKTRKAYQEKE